MNIHVRHALQALLRGSRLFLIGVGVFYVALSAWRAIGGPLPLLVTSQSLNPGWYLVEDRVPLELRRGQLVRWNYVPPAWLRAAPYADRARPFLKRVVGVPGDRLHWEDDVLVLCPGGKDAVIDGCSAVAKAIPHDGRQLTYHHAQFPAVIPDDQYLLLADHPLSMDGRYLGLISRSSVTGVARPWMTKPVDYQDLRARVDHYYATHPTLESARRPS